MHVGMALNPKKTMDSSWNTPYIHGADEDVQLTANDTDVTDLNVVLTIFLDDRPKKFSLSQFLKACWTDGFDTPCATCKGTFDLATSPPVRLLSLDHDTKEVDPLVKILPHLVVKNYHLICLRTDKVKYIPVSHAWHSSIAEAYALRRFNAKAAQICYENPVRTLLAVVQRFGSDFSIWHDYISIPQWQDGFRGTAILPRIFKIFQESGCAILHLQHRPPIEVVQAPTLDMMHKHNNDMKRFFNAHLFTRLWPMLEFDRAGEAYVMNNDYEITGSKFSGFVKQVLHAINVDPTTMQHNQVTSLRWIYNLPLFIQERQADKCLGYVYDMIADQGCRSFRDKFIGAAELLDIPDYPTELPSDAEDACLWLAERQIRGNDLSPLLLRPSKGTMNEKACWLKGHKSITRNMWGWGTQTHPAERSARIYGHTVYLDLDLVGTITHELSWGLRAELPTTGAMDDLSCLVRSAQGSTVEFLRLLDSVDLSLIFYSEHRSGIQQHFTPECDVGSSGIIFDTLSNLLQKYIMWVDTDDSTECARLCDAIVSLLALSASNPAPDLGHLRYLSFPQLHRQLCDPLERTLVSVSCPTCRKQSTFRVEVWQKPKFEACLYLIPGLTYQYTASNGTGIIMERDHIIGRARFCASACNCNRFVPVKIP
jgi:hypothetical protein